jgi:alcohol dehydrogenase, propanol-preferring
VVGTVVETGPDASRFSVGDRVGIAWLRQTCGRCRFCRSGAENLCHESLYTGWDADGGYADWTIVDELYGYRIPEEFADEQAAPLLCAGIIGYRALRRSSLPSGGRLGIYGFGASAHLAAQLAIWEGARVHVMTRSENAQQLALALGASSAGATDAVPPEPLDAAILFAPVGELVPVALAALDRGGTLAIAGIHLSDVPSLSYQRHLFQERSVRSVTANTRRDGSSSSTWLPRPVRVRAHTGSTDQRGATPPLVAEVEMTTAPGQLCRVVVVDDDPDIRLLLRVVLDAEPGLEVIAYGRDGRDPSIGPMSPA